MKDHVIWVKLKKEFIKSEFDVYLALVYFKPNYSNTDKNEFYNKLIKDIAYFSPKCKILMAGDFNARTNIGLYYVEPIAQSRAFP